MAKGRVVPKSVFSRLPQIVFDAIPDLVVLQDAKHRIVWANKAAAESVGLGLDGLVGRACYKVFEERLRPCQGCPLRKVRISAEPRVGEVRGSDGRVWLVRGFPIKDKEGNLTHILVVSTELTEHKLDEEKIRVVNSLLSIARDCALAALSASDESELYGEVCKAVINSGEYLFCWIGSAGDGEKEPYTLAFCKSPKRAKMDVSDFLRNEEVQLAIRNAISTGEPQVIARRWRESEELGAARGHRVSSLDEAIGFTVVLPLRLEENGEEKWLLLCISPRERLMLELYKEEFEALVKLASDLLRSVIFLRARKELEAEQLNLSQLLQSAEEIYDQIIEVLTRVVELWDPYTAGHQQRVARLCVAISKEMRLSQERVRGLSIAARIHDIGKLYVPSSILSRPGKLSEVEIAMIRTHPTMGHAVLKGLKFPWPLAEVVLQHHERMDGSGYPQGLSDDEIMLEARILAVADVLEAVSSWRPYRPAYGLARAKEEILKGRGSLYDADVVDACLRALEDKRLLKELDSFARVGGGVRR